MALIQDDEPWRKDFRSAMAYCKPAANISGALGATVPVIGMAVVARREAGLGRGVAGLKASNGVLLTRSRSAGFPKLDEPAAAIAKATIKATVMTRKLESRITLISPNGRVTGFDGSTTQEPCQQKFSMKSVP